MIHFKVMLKVGSAEIGIFVDAACEETAAEAALIMHPDFEVVSVHKIPA
ncbi:MAG: hypothetical protein LC650_05580 [Actinobacteria bacterium]|nr:hypothetical protein [Actinomycetota bacterium]